MICRLALAVLLFTMPAVADDKKDEKKPDELTGTWIGQTAEMRARQGGLIGTWTFKDGKLVTDQGKGAVEHTYKIDPSKTPKQIDTTRKDGNVRQGIYKIEKETLTICEALGNKGAGGGKRPEEFDASKRDDVVVLTFRRKKE